MFEHLRAYLARPTFFLALGIAIGALLAPAFGSDAAQGVTTYTRAVSCHGTSFLPLSSDSYSVQGARRVTLSDGVFACDAALPHKAVVTRVRFTLFDNSTGSVHDCFLLRTGLDPAKAQAFDVLASVPETSNSINAQRLADTSIAFATIDNMQFVYRLQCFITAGGAEEEGIFGADITYKITASNG